MSLAKMGTFSILNPLLPDTGASAMVNPAPKFNVEGGVVTAMMVSVPGFAIAEAGICACNSVEEMNVLLVVAIPPTVMSGAKFFPVTVSVNAGPPATTEPGLTERTTGAVAEGLGP